LSVLTIVTDSLRCGYIDLIHTMKQGAVFVVLVSQSWLVWPVAAMTTTAAAAATLTSPFDI